MNAVNSRTGIYEISALSSVYVGNLNRKESDPVAARLAGARCERQEAENEAGRQVGRVGARGSKRYSRRARNARLRPVTECL